MMPKMKQNYTDVFLYKDRGNQAPASSILSPILIYNMYNKLLVLLEVTLCTCQHAQKSKFIITADTQSVFIFADQILFNKVNCFMPLHGST